MKKFLVKTSVFALIILLGLTGVNYFGDAAHLFDASYNQEIVDILSKGKNATNLSNYDERHFQRLWIGSYTEVPKTIVLGSSRSLDIRSDFFPNYSFKNNSVTGASIQDLIGVYQLYKEKGHLPEQIFINCDPWLLNQNNGRTKWFDIAKEYNAFFERPYTVKNQTNWDQLISFSYFQSSFKNLKKVLKGESRPQLSSTVVNTKDTKLFDGSLAHGKAYQNLSKSEVNKRAKAYILGEVYGISNFDSLSTTIQFEFETMIKDMLDKGVEVTFLLTPYHPIVFDEVQKNYPKVLASEEYFKSLAKVYNCKVFGSFDPDSCKLDETHFFDGMHLTFSGMKAFFEKNVKPLE